MELLTTLHLLLQLLLCKCQVNASTSTRLPAHGGSNMVMLAMALLGFCPCSLLNGSSGLEVKTNLCTHRTIKAYRPR